MKTDNLSILTNITLEDYDLKDIRHYTGDQKKDDRCFVEIGDEAISVTE